MDYDEDDDRRCGLDAADPVPPDDWAGFGRSAPSEALYLAQKPYLAGFFRRNAHPQDVADLVQESFRRVFTAKRFFTGDDNPGAYLAQTARTLLKERARKGTRRQQGAHHSFEDHHVAGPDPHAALEARDMIRRVEEAIARLNPTTRDVLTVKAISWSSVMASSA